MELFGKFKFYMMANIHFNFINNRLETDRILIKTDNMEGVLSY